MLKVLYYHFEFVKEDLNNLIYWMLFYMKRDNVNLQHNESVKTTFSDIQKGSYWKQYIVYWKKCFIRILKIIGVKNQLNIRFGTVLKRKKLLKVNNFAHHTHKIYNHWYKKFL